MEIRAFQELMRRTYFEKDQARGQDGTLDPARAGDLLKAETTYARYAALELAW